jgi:hypothetical protein
MEGGIWHPLRFSYAFPASRDDLAGTIAELATWYAAFGSDVAGWAGTVLRYAHDPAIERLLFGLAWDSPERWRVKLYLELSPGARALRHAARLVGNVQIPSRFEGRELPLVGLDLGPRGLVGAKLYFRLAELSLAAPPPFLTDVELLGELAPAIPVLRDVLLIHRFGGPNDEGGWRVSELDFALPENGLHWCRVGGLRSLRRLRSPGDLLERLERSFPLGFRRISVPVGRPEKLNAYYVLAQGSVGR